MNGEMYLPLLNALLRTATIIPPLDKPNYARITGGQMVNIEDYPYQISLIFLNIHICGGSLIHPKYVLTAAHCTDGFGPEFFKVRAGTSYVDQNGVVREVVDIFSPTEFDPAILDYDISILELNKSFELNTRIQVIKLPPANYEIPDSSIGKATGWGLLWNNGPAPTQLQMVEMPTIDHYSCLHIYELLTERMFCAGFDDGGKDTCSGDSGGPYIVNGILQGIILGGWSECGAAHYPAVFTKVSRFVDFINTTISKPVL